MYVYFVRAQRSDMIKIGRATNPSRRLSGLQTSSPDRLSLMGVIKDVHTEVLEAKLHKRFAKARARGEWFHPTPALLRYIAANAGPVDLPTSAEDMERRMIAAFGA